MTEQLAPTPVGAPSSAAVGPSHAQFAVLDAFPNAIVAVDQGGRISYVNAPACSTFDYTRSDLLGRGIEVLLPERVRERHVAHRESFLAHPMARPIGIGLDLVGRRRDGTEFPVEISLSPVETLDGLQVVATVVDITARKSAEHQVIQEQTLKSLGRLAARIAHDFNNMLFAIQGYAEILGEDLSVERRTRLDPDGALATVDQIREAADRATSLTARLVAFSRNPAVTASGSNLDEAVLDAVRHDVDLEGASG